MFVFDESGVRDRRGFTGVAVLAAVCLTAGALWLTQPGTPSAAAPAPGQAATGQAAQAAPAQPVTKRSGSVCGDDLCSRTAADSARRTSLTTSPADFDAETHRIAGAVTAALCPPAAVSTCGTAQASPATDIALVRATITGQGFPAATVRFARPRDPAPDGSVVYAVPLTGGACFVAYAVRGIGSSTPPAVGKLPDGRCLDA
ncbi:hypothetical protein KOI35_15100 [Actinoplanes bogorensis]|uniref:Uncharacterized protein n=1 Tax=Paractinoplanes bogorensis TaxID=1610840 RepID=A0ABS5YMZ0_9ACTN|nr:hypothetical protein [Actinoplanes bogorensis]MBU2664828.1 hypothetical protein [Actinoplanes bogorensis]